MATSSNPIDTIETIPVMEVSAVRRSEDVKELVVALVKAQLEFTTVVKDMENEAYKRGQKASKYATLASAVNATRPALNKHGLTIIQHIHTDNTARETVITSTLIHVSGQYWESDLCMPSVNQQGRFDPQTVASATTYGRRVAWLAITGEAPEDDDGNAAAGIGTKEAAQAVAQAKIAEHEAKANGSVVPALFYTWFDDSQSARIEGDKALMERNRDLLTRFWQPAVKAVVCNAEELENLKYALEQRNIPFKLLKTVPAIEKQLEMSIAEVKTRKAKEAPMK